MNDTLDANIEQTLRADAKELRAKFPTVPGERLTAKLAIATAGKGLFRSLGAKLALYATGAAIIGAAAYYIPGLHSSSAEAPSISKNNSFSRNNSLPAAQTAVHEQHSVSTALPIEQPGETPTSTPAVKKPMVLDEGNGKNVRVIRDKHYKGPLN